jgi:site-specific recombinase XerD
MTAIAATIQAFFTERLIHQRRASPHTIAAYRDTLRLLLVFAGQRHHTSPAHLDLTDLDAPTIAVFLDHLQHQRGNSIRTRNAPYPQAVVAFDLGESVGKDTPPCALC